MTGSAAGRVVVAWREDGHVFYSIPDRVTLTGQWRQDNPSLYFIDPIYETMPFDWEFAVPKPSGTRKTIL